MYVLNVVLYIHIIILNVHQIIGRENGDTRTANIMGFSCAMFTSTGLFTS